MTLAEFLAARLGDREAAALAAGGGARERQWDAIGPGHQEGRVVDGHGDVIVYDEGSPTFAQAQHIAMNDPDYALRDVAAKRKILAAHQPEPSARPPSEDHKLPCVVCSQDWWPCDVLRTLGEIDSGHPDYNPEWRP